MLQRRNLQDGQNVEDNNNNRLQIIINPETTTNEATFVDLLVILWSSIDSITILICESTINIKK